MRLIFMGSPDFAVPSLEKLAAVHDITSVYTQPPRQSGRGMQQTPTAIAKKATELSLPVRWPDSLKDKAVQDEIAAEQPEAIIVVAYGLLLPQAILDIPVYGCINGHASLLPRWRGAAPIQRAIEAGDAETGTMAMLMEAGLDTGPVLAERRTPIETGDTAASLHDRLALLSADCLADTIADISAKGLHPTPQSETGISYAAKINTSETELDFHQSAHSLACKIRAFSPYPGCWIKGQSGQRLKCLMAGIASDQLPAGLTHTDIRPGDYLGQAADGGLLMATGDGLLSISTLQPAGKKPMSARDFLNGRPLIDGQPLAAQV